MAADPAYVREFKKFTQGQPTVADLERLEDELYGASDRASAVMAASFAESALEALLRSKVRPAYNADDIRRLFEFSGILGSFGAKITAGYAFNWFGPDTRHDLDLIRLLRNEFAHSRRSFGFMDAPVAVVCAHLRSPDWPGSRIPLGALTRAADEHDIDKTHPRTRYRSACHTVSLGLLDHAGKGIGPGEYTDLR